jgi:hypothetical protein
MRPAFFVSLIVATVLCLPSLAAAQSPTEKEAKRQLEFARDEVRERNYEKALASADSALRLHPALYEAFVFKALAYEGLGDMTKAEGYLVAYSDLSGAEGPMPEASKALNRIREGQGAVAASGKGDPTVVTTAVPGVEVSDLPSLPPGSESLTAWLLLQQRAHAAEAQRNAGIAFIAAGGGMMGLGGGLVGAASAASQANPNDPNNESMHAAGLGSLMAGAVVFAVGLPLTVGSAAQASKLRKDAAYLSASAAAPRFEVGAQGLALRFP